MFRILLCSVAIIWMAAYVEIPSASAQEPASGVDAAVAIEKTSST